MRLLRRPQPGREQALGPCAGSSKHQCGDQTSRDCFRPDLRMCDPARRECFHSRACSNRAGAMPRTESSFGAPRATASPRLSIGLAARAGLHPPRYRFRTAGRCCYARIAIAPHQQPRRPLRRWRGRASGDGARVRDRAVLADDGVASKRPTVCKRKPRPCRKSVLLRTKTRRLPPAAGVRSLGCSLSSISECAR